MKQTNIGNYRWVICALLFFATTINYIDRQILGLLKPTLETEFNWTETDYANIVMVFADVMRQGTLFSEISSIRSARNLVTPFLSLYGALRRWHTLL